MQLIISSTTLGRDAFSTCGRQVKLRNATGKATTTVLRIEINVLHCKERLNAMRNCRCWWVIFHGQKDTYIWDYSLLFLICLLTILFQYAEFFCGTIFFSLKGMFCQSKMYFTTLIKNVLLSYTLLLYRIVTVTHSHPTARELWQNNARIIMLLLLSVLFILPITAGL